MRNIGHQWRNLAEGLLRIEALEAQFRAEWSPLLEEARQKRNEAKRQRTKRQGQVALVAAFVAALLLLTLALVLLLFSSPAVTVVLWLALVVPMVLVFCGAGTLLYVPDSFPGPSDLSTQWWRTISGRAPSVQRSGPALSARCYGDEGEVAFISYLTGKLPEAYVAVRGLLVARNLDADVIVAGPTGIWVYEVKHWSGEITCERGEWRRVKTYRQPGGRLVQEHEVVRPFDKQWIKEANAAKETLRRRLPQYPNLHDVVGGGIVFTHGAFSLRADSSCKARVYTPRSCVEALLGSSRIPDLTLQKRLRIIDALLKWSDRLHEQQGEASSATSSSVELAERLHEDAVSRAVSYVSGIGEPSSVAVSEEVKEARKRAVWHPHPDDPPKS